MGIKRDLILVTVEGGDSFSSFDREEMQGQVTAMFFLFLPPKQPPPPPPPPPFPSTSALKTSRPSFCPPLSSAANEDSWFSPPSQD